MSVSVIDWLNQWLPFAKLLTLAALIFLFPLLLEACNRLRYRPLRLSASQRHDVWGIALIVWALSPILCVNEVTWSIPIKAFPATDASRSVSDLSLPLIRIPLTNNETISSNLELQEEETKTFAMEHPASFGSKPPLERMETMDRTDTSSLRISLGWQHVWLALSTTGTVLLLIRLVRAQIIATALVRSANLGRESRFIQDLMRQCSISIKIRLGWSECTSVPILIGWLQPVILLPREAQNWPPCKLESVLLHEHAHIQRADLLWLRLANIICAIYWVQPWVWFASHRMRCLREEACDDLVIGFGKDRREYSEHLIQIAERATYPVINVAGLGIARSTSLGNRIIGILDLRRNRARSSRRFKSIVCFALTILFGSVLLGIPNQAVGIAIPMAAESPSEIQDNDSMKKDDAEQSSLTMTLSGNVVDSDGKPVANCMVWGRGWNESMKEEFRQTRTDPQGMFALTLPNSSAASDRYMRNHIMTYHENCIASLPSLPSNSVSGLRLKLEPCRTISLEVKNAAHEPISEAQLMFVSSDEGRDFYAVDRDFQFILNRPLVSDQNGRLDVIVPHWCLTPRVIVAHPDYCDQTLRVELDRESKIVMDQGTEIAIQLRTSIPDLRLEDSMMQMFGNNTYIFPVFDSSGFARVRVNGFPYSLELKHPRMGTKSGQVVIARQTIKGPIAIVEMEIKPLTTVSGKLVDGDSGLPAVGCHVFLRDLADSSIWHRWGGALTNDVGEFKIECSSATRAQLQVESNGDYELPKKPEILVDRLGEEGVVLPNILVHHRKRIGIRVVDNAGSPVEGALIAYGAPNEQFATTDQGGHATLVPRAKAELLRILHPKQRLAYFDSWAPIADKEETIVLQPETEITGRVVDLEGAPISNVPLSIHVDAISIKNNSMNSYRYAGVTDADGMYRMRGISKHVESFMVLHPLRMRLDLQVPWQPKMVSNSLSEIQWDRKLLEQKRTANQAQDEFRCQEWWNGQISLREQINRTVIVREFFNLRDWDEHDLVELERFRIGHHGKDVTCVVLISSDVSRKKIEQAIQRLKLGYSIGHLSPEATSTIGRDYAPHTRILRPTAEQFNRCVVPIAYGPLPLSIRNAILYSDER